MKKKLLYLISFILTIIIFVSCDSSSDTTVQMLESTEAASLSTELTAPSDLSSMPIPSAQTPLTVDEAFAIYNTWLEKHANISSYTLDRQSYEQFELSGEQYYLFHADEIDMYWYNILVHIETGELLFMMTPDGLDPVTSIERLDDWYDKNFATKYDYSRFIGEWQYNQPNSAWGIILTIDDVKNNDEMNITSYNESHENLMIVNNQIKFNDINMGLRHNSDSYLVELTFYDNYILATVYSKERYLGDDIKKESELENYVDEYRLTSDIDTVKTIESPNLEVAVAENDANDVSETDAKSALSIVDKQKYLDLLLSVATRDKFYTVKVQGQNYNQFDTDGYYKVWDEQLNKIYGLLAAKLSAEDMKNLQAEQRQWIKIRDEKARTAKERKNNEVSAKNAYTEALADATKRRTYELIDMYFPKEENWDVLYPRAMRAYGAVLRNEDEIYDEYLGKYYLSQVNDLFEAGLDPKTQVVSGFTIVDINGDDVPEVMVGLSFGGMRLVLHYEDGVVFGNAFGNRQVGDPKQDGTFGWSGGAGYNGYGKLSLYKDLYEIVGIGRRDSEDFDKPYLIGDEKVTEKEYFIFSDEQDEKEDAVWYDFTKESIEKEVTNYLR